MRTIIEIKGSITSAIQEAVATNDERLLDAAIQDYQSLLKGLASKGQFQAINDLVSNVQGLHKITDLINLKGAVSSGVLTKALSLTSLYIGALPVKASARRFEQARRNEKPNSPPNAEQSLAIARAMISSRTEDLDEIIRALRYFADVGHQQAMAALIGHCLDTDLIAADDRCDVFGSMTHLVGKNSLHASLLKVFKERSELVDKEFKRMALKWSSLAESRHFKQVFKLDMLEKMYKQGLRDQAVIFGSAYDTIHVYGVQQERCSVIRLRNIGVESVSIIRASERGKSGFGETVSPIPWLEDLMTNEAVMPGDIQAKLRGFDFDYNRKDDPFKAVRNVIEYQSENAEESGISRSAMLEKAAEVIRITIEARSLSRDTGELNKIIDDYRIPNDLALKVRALKGIVLERDLGM